MATELERGNGLASHGPMVEHAVGDAWYQHIQFGRSSSAEIFAAYRASTQFQDILARYQEELAEHNGVLTPEETKQIKNELKREVFTDIALAYLIQMYPKVRPGEYLGGLLPRKQDGQQTDRRGSLVERDKIHDLIGATVHGGADEQVIYVVMCVAEDTSHIGTVAALGALRMRGMMKQSPKKFSQDARLLVVIPDGGQFDTNLGFRCEVVPKITVRDIGDFVRKGIVESSYVVSKGKIHEEAVGKVPEDPPGIEEGLDPELASLLAFVRDAHTQPGPNKKKRR